MQASDLFGFANTLVIVPWLMMLLLPYWEWTRKLIFHAWIPMLLGCAYVVAFWFAWPFPEEGSFSSLEGVMTFFQDPWLATAGWIHYLAFDLFVGAWELRDAQRRGINHLLVVPCLVITFLAGPAGLLLYFIVRGVSKRTFTMAEA